MLVRFLEFAPKFQEALLTPGRLADPRECSATLKGSSHSHHMPVSLCNHTWGHESFPQSNSCISVTFGTPEEQQRDTEKLMQEQGKDQNGNEDIWPNSPNANGEDLTQF